MKRRNDVLNGASGERKGYVVGSCIRMCGLKEIGRGGVFIYSRPVLKRFDVCAVVVKGYNAMGPCDKIMR